MTPFLWSFLWPISQETVANRTPMKRIKIILEYTIPQLYVLVEFVFLNSIPLARRQYFPFLFIVFTMIFVSFGTLFNLGVGKFPLISFTTSKEKLWEYAGVFLIPLLMIIYTLIMMYLFETLSYKKLRWLGYQNLNDVVYGKGPRDESHLFPIDPIDQIRH